MTKRKKRNKRKSSSANVVDELKEKLERGGDEDSISQKDISVRGDMDSDSDTGGEDSVSQKELNIRDDTDIELVSPKNSGAMSKQEPTPRRSYIQRSQSGRNFVFEKLTYYSDDEKLTFKFRDIPSKMFFDVLKDRLDEQDLKSTTDILGVNLHQNPIYPKLVCKPEKDEWHIHLVQPTAWSKIFSIGIQTKAAFKTDCYGSLANLFRVSAGFVLFVLLGYVATTVLEVGENFSGNLMPEDNCYFQYDSFVNTKSKCKVLQELNVVIPQIDTSASNTTWFHASCTSHTEHTRTLADWFGRFSGKHQLIPLIATNNYKCPCLTMNEIPSVYLVWIACSFFGLGMLLNAICTYCSKSFSANLLPYMYTIYGSVRAKALQHADISLNFLTIDTRNIGTVKKGIWSIVSIGIGNWLISKSWVTLGMAMATTGAGAISFLTLQYRDLKINLDRRILYAVLSVANRIRVKVDQKNILKTEIQQLEDLAKVCTLSVSNPSSDNKQDEINDWVVRGLKEINKVAKQQFENQPLHEYRLDSAYGIRSLNDVVVYSNEKFTCGEVLQYYVGGKSALKFAYLLKNIVALIAYVVVGLIACLVVEMEDQIVNDRRCYTKDELPPKLAFWVALGIQCMMIFAMGVAVMIGSETNTQQKILSLSGKIAQSLEMKMNKCNKVMEDDLGRGDTKYNGKTHFANLIYSNANKMPYLALFVSSLVVGAVGLIVLNNKRTANYYYIGLYMIFGSVLVMSQNCVWYAESQHGLSICGHKVLQHYLDWMKVQFPDDFDVEMGNVLKEMHAIREELSEGLIGYNDFGLRANIGKLAMRPG
jgi:hypothetical protein